MVIQIVHPSAFKINRTTGFGPKTPKDKEGSPGQHIAIEIDNSNDGICSAKQLKIHNIPCLFNNEFMTSTIEFANEYNAWMVLTKVTILGPHVNNLWLSRFDLFLIEINTVRD